MHTNFVTDGTPCLTMGLRDDIRTQWRTGGMLVRLILVNVGVFLALLFIDLGFLLGYGDRIMAHDMFQHYIVQWIATTWVVNDLVLRPWTIVTYMFTHVLFWHAFWNLFVLWFIGRFFQDLLGGKRLLGNYLLGGIAGFTLYFAAYNLLPFIRDPGSMGMVGASAAVMSVMMGIAAYRPGLLIHLPLLGEVKLIYVAAVVLVLDLIAIRQGGNSGGHIAHLGGALYGYFAARQLAKGHDRSLQFVTALEAIGRAFRPRTGGRMRVEKKPPRNVHSRDEAYHAAKVGKQARVDAILDKISRSGYDSLSKEEKDFLFKASN